MVLLFFSRTASVYLSPSPATSDPHPVALSSPTVGRFPRDLVSARVLEIEEDPSEPPKK